MKKLLLIPLLSVCLIARGQFTAMQSTVWLSDDLKYLSFHEDRVNFSFGDFDDEKTFEFKKDTLIMIDWYTTSADNFKTQHITLFKFLTEHPGKQTLALKPLDHNADSIAHGKSIMFKDQRNLNSPNIKFDKIHFSSGRCFGTCPILKLEIDNSGNYYLLGEQYAEPFLGNFKGKLTSIQLDTLNYLLRHSMLEKMFNWQQKGIVMDAPMYNLTIAFNRKVLTISTTAPPRNLYDLIDFLVNSYKKVNMHPDPEKHISGKNK